MSGPPAYPIGNVTFLFTDVENSTVMTNRLERLGRRGIYEAVLQEPQRERLKAEAESRRGFEIQRNGDGHLFVFQKAADALACVVAFQRSLLADPIAHREGDEAFALRVRAGVHTAQLQRDPKPLENGLVEYPGADTSFAFRVMSLGQGGQVLASESTAMEAMSLGAYRLHPWTNRLLKSFEDRAYTVHEILYDEGQTPREPGMQWLPDWYQAEKKLYIERPAKEAEVIEQFLRKAPGPGASFAGRAAARDGHRIVTIKGEGGMGKSRLAVACAAKVADLFPDGVHFVPLVLVEPDENAVAEAIGRALGLGNQESRPDSVLDYLRPRTLLLILDNYESMTPPADDPEPRVARYLGRLIAGANNLRLLVTGRSPVKIRDVEKVILLDDGMEDQEALDLFLDRARLRWDDDRELTDAERPHWVRIRDLTARIPLALELAAAWVEYAELREIADGLARTPLGAETGLPPGDIRFDSEVARSRHDTLTRSFDWSFNLLGKTAGPAAQSLFAACGLFADSFDAPTLATIAADPAARKHLIHLQDASLVRREPGAGATRYNLHRFAREYALQRLAAFLTADATRGRFLAHYVALVRANASDPNHRDGYLLLDQEWRNALAASQLAGSVPGGPSLLSMHSLGEYFLSRGLWSEAESLYLRCLAITQVTSPRSNEGSIWNNLGNVYQLQGRYDEALEALGQDLAICREYKDRVGEGRTLGNMGIVYQLQGRYDEALEALEQDLAICREYKDRVGEGRALGNMAGVYRLQGRHDEALEALGQDLAICREYKDRVGEGQTLGNMGVVYRLQGRHDEALEALGQDLAICREYKDRVGEGQTLGNMAGVYQLQGRYEEALDALGRSLAIRREYKDGIGEGQTLENLAILLESRGRRTEAIQWARQAVAVLRTTEAKAACEKALRTLKWLEVLAAADTGAVDG
ncbi:tetratricopeptide repeat protein [Tundrisphaera sp. TA3]|uniref:tetratricopeptide repeat protein n=1 Tax=Tundrisphaera sp. TA3 TaxID=3435775 RepID=UPI003EBC456E